MNDTTFVSLVCIVDRNANAELAEMAEALERHFPLHELVATVREPDGAPPTLPNLHVVHVAPPADDRVRLAAALDRCLGDVVVIAEPARDDSHAVVQAAALVAAGTDAVYELSTEGGRRRRWLHDASRGALSRAAGVTVPPVEGVRACTREVLSAWIGDPDRDRLVEAFPAVTGRGWSALPRAEDSPTSRRPVRWQISALLAASAAPLRLAYVLALVGAGLNLLYTGWVVAINIVRGTTEGWTSLSLQAAGMFFLISLILAILAEYIFQVVKRAGDRPLYRVRTESSSSSMPIRDHLNVEQSAGSDGR